MEDASVAFLRTYVVQPRAMDHWNVDGTPLPTRALGKGDVVIRHGELVENVFIVKQGTLLVRHYMLHDVAPVLTLRRGSFFGDILVISGRLAEYDVVVTSDDAEVFVLPHHSLHDRIMAAHGNLCDLMRHLASMIDNVLGEYVPYLRQDKGELVGADLQSELATMEGHMSTVRVALDNVDPSASALHNFVRGHARRTRHSDCALHTHTVAAAAAAAEAESAAAAEAESAEPPRTMPFSEWLRSMDSVFERIQRADSNPALETGPAAAAPHVDVAAEDLQPFGEEFMDELFRLFVVRLFVVGMGRLAARRRSVPTLALATGHSSGSDDEASLASNSIAVRLVSCVQEPAAPVGALRSMSLPDRTSLSRHMSSPAMFSRRGSGGPVGKSALDALDATAAAAAATAAAAAAAAAAGMDGEGDSDDEALQISVGRPPPSPSTSKRNIKANGISHTLPPSGKAALSNTITTTAAAPRRGSASSEPSRRRCSASSDGGASTGGSPALLGGKVAARRGSASSDGSSTSTSSSSSSSRARLGVMQLRRSKSNLESSMSAQHMLGFMQKLAHDMQEDPRMHTPGVVSEGETRDPHSYNYAAHLCSREEILDNIERAYTRLGLVQHFQLEPARLHAFVQRVGELYGDSPYHNFLHAVDVTMTLVWLLERIGAWQYLCAEDILALVAAAFGHDAGHPGNTNAFEVQIGSALARKHDNVSVLEKMHTEHTLRLLDETGLLAHLNDDVRAAVVKGVRVAILATDMAFHFAILAEAERGGDVLGRPVRRKTRNERYLLMRLLIKAADISNPTKCAPLALRWARNYVREVYSEFVKKKEHGLVAPDGTLQLNVASVQIGFISGCVRPLFERLLMSFPRLSPCARNLRKNLNRYANYVEQYGDDDSHLNDVVLTGVP